jgi:hypothetical protein
MRRLRAVTAHEDTVPLTLRLPPDVHAALTEDKRRTGKSLNSLIVEAAAAATSRRRRARERRRSQWATSAASASGAR